MAAAPVQLLGRLSALVFRVSVMLLPCPFGVGQQYFRSGTAIYWGLSGMWSPVTTEAPCACKTTREKFCRSGSVSPDLPLCAQRAPRVLFGCPAASRTRRLIEGLGRTALAASGVSLLALVRLDDARVMSGACTRMVPP